MPHSFFLNKGDDDIFVIAEIGKNFIQSNDERSTREYLENAKALIDSAVYAGADAVKFQTHEVEDEQHPKIEIVSPHFKGSDRYQWVSRNTKITPLSFWLELKEYCDKKNIIFFSTPMSRKAAQKLDRVGVPLWKVGSGDIMDVALLDYITETKKPVIISNGMVSHKELEGVVRYLEARGAPTALLYCVSQYPAPKEYFNLGTIEYLIEKYPNVTVGFSDHSLGWEVTLAAAKMGARIIEKHFSLDRNLWGSDHKVSMTPEEMKEMVGLLRDRQYENIDEKPFYGKKEKELEGANNTFRPYFHKTLVAGEDIPRGAIITKDMVYAMRPHAYLDGLPSWRFDDVIGQKVRKAVKRYEPLSDSLFSRLPASFNLPRKRKICFIITSFIHYSRSIFLLEELKNRADVELHIVIGGTALLSKYSATHAYVKTILERDGFKHIYEVHFNLEGDSYVIKAKTAGLGLIEFSLLFNHIRPDVVMVRGDRFEVLSAALAASYMHIPVAHIEGGDVTGTLDEAVRHSITKLSHIHFATNEMAKKRILRMGEDKKYVFNFGSPEIEVVRRLATGEGNEVSLSKTGSGAEISLQKKYIMVMFHPVTNEKESIRSYTRALLEAVHGSKMQALWFWPNFDSGAEEISHELRKFKETTPDHKIRFLRYLPPREFLFLLGKTQCLVGNSSSGIKECSYLGTPVVNVGTRQKGRLYGESVMHVPYEAKKIHSALQKQLSHGRYAPSDIYGGENTSQKIAETIATVPLYVQKSFSEFS